MKSIFFVFIIFSWSLNAQEFTKYVNPMIGTGGHGHTYPGATVPFGFVQLSPDTRNDGYNDWDGCSGYHYNDSIIYGFSHTHLSGTGVPDYCDVLLSPFVDHRKETGEEHQSYASQFSHLNEHASPGYYSVLLDNDSIFVELTATARVGMHKYLFPASNYARIELDLTHRDKLLEGSFIEIISPTKIQGLRRSSSWAKDQWLYFAIEFSSPFNVHAIFNGEPEQGSTSATIVSGTGLKSFFGFKTNGKDPIYVKCALSPVSCAGAWKNMSTEIPGWDFEQVKQQANETWNKELSKIEVTSIEDEKKSLSDSTNKLVIFYTTLYHCMLAPNIYEDVDGRYRGRDNKIHVADGFDYYTVFSLWDTYRALHPLLTIIDQKRTSDFINTFLKQYEQGGRLPVWELSSNETDCMIGYHSVSVIADAAVKGIKGFDYNLAYEAMKHSSNLDIYGLKYYKEKGFIESNEEPESVSKTMEYSYDDWCIAQMGKVVHADSAEFQYYNNRGLNYLNLNDRGFARPRINGGWYSPFNATEVNFNFTEANSFQYSFSYPQNTYYTDRKLLDSLFNSTLQTTGRVQSDITGLIGQYAHGNEPSHHIAYLFAHTGEADKTQYRVNQIVNNFYKNTPDGLIGNEDCGQMSAWYVLSSIGFYQVCPAAPIYTIGSPAFNFVKVNLENQDNFIVEATNVSTNNFYVQSAMLNGKKLNYTQVDYEELLAGANLQFEMGNKPSEKLSGGGSIETKYKSQRLTTGYLMTAPIIESKNNPFMDSTIIYINSFPFRTFYTTNGDEPNLQSEFVDGLFPLKIKESTTVKAFRCDPLGQCSSVSTAHFTKLPYHYNLTYLTKYNSQYNAGGDNGLIDGLHGSSDFRTGMWQGWEGENMEVLLDLGEKKEITKAGAGFLQDIRSWIWMPVKLEIYISDDGKNYRLLKTINNTIAGDNYESKEIQNMSASFTSVQTRYIKFVALTLGTVPNWHPGARGKSWIFCDEVWVE